MRHPEPTSLPNRALATILYTRTITNLNFRIVYPFLPAIARGLGIPLEAAGLLVSVQGGVGLAAPLFGHLSDSHGRRRLMEAGLIILALSAALVVLTGQYLPVLFAFAGFGMAKALFDPAMLAYVGDAVPYARRGRVIAITELAWSFAWLLGVPFAGLLIERAGWRSPWWAILFLSLAGIAATRLVLPPARRERPAGSSPPAATWQVLLSQPPIRAALFTAFGMIFALENLFIVYGAFLENRFGLAIGAIGLASIVIGLSELLAEGSAAAWTDRLGKRRSVIVGFLLFAAILAALPLFSGQLAIALGGFALAIFFFEFTIVSFIPLVSELAPEARATVLSLNVGVMGAGRMVAAITGAALYARTGSLVANSLLSALVCLLCAGVMWHWVAERE